MVLSFALVSFVAVLSEHYLDLQTSQVNEIQFGCDRLYCSFVLLMDRNCEHAVGF
jgi:hypothetical protein